MEPRGGKKGGRNIFLKPREGELREGGGSSKNTGLWSDYETFFLLQQEGGNEEGMMAAISWEGGVWLAASYVRLLLRPPPFLPPPISEIH